MVNVVRVRVGMLTHVHQLVELLFVTNLAIPHEKNSAFLRRDKHQTPESNRIEALEVLMP